ncbi:MAG: PEP-CTERM sorting domain-containing protein [Rhodoferax sp.]|nr:PEP-CTERM sorting domain-containing protein [Rhodoferax sp.]MCP5261615.1 PEP-CTERM sorting domain-containing protein [Rhodoferax sp.]
MRAASWMFNRRPVAWATALVCLGMVPAWAGVGTTGDFSVYPVFIQPGPGDTDLGNNFLGLGNNGVGSLLVDGGSFLSAAAIQFGNGGSGVATGLIDGAGTRVNLVGDGNTNRLEVGNWGRGSLTVSGGATLDGRASSAACLTLNRWCNNFIGNAAGSDGLFTVTGAGSNASFLHAFVIGGLAVFRPPIETFTFGTPGASTRGRVEVLGGGTLTTDGASIGVAPGGSSPLGTERSFAEVLIDGTDSVWRITGNLAHGYDPFVGTANHRNAVATISLTNGGAMEIQGPQGHVNGGGMNLTNGGGRTDMSISGIGSKLAFTGDATYLQVGRRLGSAVLSVLGGGSVTGVQYVSVGRDGSFGELLLEGAGSLLSASGTVSPESRGGGATLPFVASMDIGRNGNGTVTVRDGARLEVTATVKGDGGPAISLGRDAASFGRLTITGAGSTVLLSAQSVLAGGGPGEAFNPFMRVGRDGSGELNISAGGKLLIDGQAVATVADPRYTSLYIGGTNAATPGGKGIATVAGLGSEIRMTGYDTGLSVGWGPQSFGQLNVTDQGKVSAIGAQVGSSGGTGVLKVDNATLQFQGQQTGGNRSGAYLVVGDGSGIGVATVSNGGVVNLVNNGSSGAGVYLGGTGTRPMGDGSLTLSGASQINVQAEPGLGVVRVGRDGSGLMRVRGGSSVNVGDGNLLVASHKGGDGTLLVSENSTITAGWVGIGRNKTDTGDVDGGTGTVVLINSTLTAPTIVVGTNGFLGGSGTINGNVINHGIFAPGNSPGTLEIDGSFTALAGSKMILEVESDGAGGFLTDLVIFKGGEPLDLANLHAEFRFLGNTDPNAFGGSGLFKLDTFFQERQADNSLAAVAPAVFDNAVFTAQADAYQITRFNFDPASGGTVIAAAVPEPEAWALMLAGLLTIGGIARRRHAAALLRPRPATQARAT